MADQSSYTYPSPLTGYESAAALPSTLAADGKSYDNPPTASPSKAYTTFTSGITNGPRGGFDLHIYYFQNNPSQTKFAYELWQRIRYEFPELRIYKFWDKPVGPHPYAMFEVNVFTPAQFGAFVPWLVINRGPLSVLLHPNSEDGDAVRDHTQRATWLGEKVPLDVGLLREFEERRGKREAEEKGTKKADGTGKVNGA
jgi:aromatic ring-cleaving dioxygenase